VAVVLAHEYGHKLSRPVTVTLGLILTVVKMLAIFYLVHWFHHRRAISEPDRLQALVHIMLAAQFVALVEYPFSCALYRYQERTSDAYALELTGDATAMRSALLKVGAANLEPWEVPDWVYLTSATHPQLRDRVHMAETFSPQ
jgi:Zn-dependent protease with chaperone function